MNRRDRDRWHLPRAFLRGVTCIVDDCAHPCDQWACSPYCYRHRRALVAHGDPHAPVRTRHTSRREEFIDAAQYVLATYLPTPPDGLPLLAELVELSPADTERYLYRYGLDDLARQLTGAVSRPCDVTRRNRNRNRERTTA